MLARRKHSFAKLFPKEGVTLEILFGDLFEDILLVSSSRELEVSLKFFSESCWKYPLADFWRDIKNRFLKLAGRSSFSQRSSRKLVGYRKFLPKTCWTRYIFDDLFCQITMYSPIPHDLTVYDDQFDFESNGFCPYQWEISVPQKNCIIWGVVLSYLRSADFTIPGKFEERLSRLSENPFDPALVKSAILDFNPFFNIHKCFFDETLQNLNQSFRKLLNEKRPSTAPKTASNDIQLISTLLKSNILIVDLGKKSLHLVTPSDGWSTGQAAITLFYRDYSNKDAKRPVVMKRFTFSLNTGVCWELRKDAFHMILESSDIRSAADKEMQQLVGKKEKRVNILIALLKKNLTHVILELYDSPHIVSKLADAGFETDPRVVDAEGFSAFYYALQSSDNILVYTLHSYAANSSYEPADTSKDPDPSVIVQKLTELKEVLREDCSRSNNFETLGEAAERARVMFRDLLRFNELLTQVSKGTVGIRGKPDDTFIKKAEKQKEIILLILDSYEAFFSAGQLDSQPISMEELTNNYTKHKTYYDNLDFTIALLFFHNIFLLKSFLKSTGLYSKLESSFLISVSTNKYFTGDEKNRKKLEDFGFELESVHLSIFPLLERLHLRESVKEFCKILRRMKLEEKDEEEMNEVLSCFPELKDEFLISRLHRYMEAALQTSSDGMKQKFVVQRALQVIGKSISDETDPSSIRSLLRKSLPDETLKVLKRTRNVLSHLKSFQFPLKFETEKDDSVFASIQSEIQNINEASGKVFDIQRIRFMEFLINRGLESVQRFQQNESSYVHSLVQSMENLREKLRQIELEILDQKGTHANLFVPNIDEFRGRLMGCASKNIRKAILDEIPLEVRTRVEANQKLLDDLDRGDSVDLDRFDSLFLEKKDMDYIKEEYFQEKFKANPPKRSSLLQKIKDSSNPLNTLDLIFEKKEISDSQLKALYDEVPFSDEAKSTLESLTGMCESPCGDNLANLLNRIEHMYEISVNERSDIRFMWERAKSSKAKQHLVYKIVQRCVSEPSFQASIEMLLFDCVGILKNNEGFRRLKDSPLFYDIDLRNVLDFGDPLVESIGDILDPKHLPSELVKKMLQLFEDRECIETLCHLWQKEKRSDNSAEWYKLKDRIVCCPRWQEYSKVLAEDPKDFETCEAIVSFLKNVTEPKRNKKY